MGGLVILLVLHDRFLSATLSYQVPDITDGETAALALAIGI